MPHCKFKERTHPFNSRVGKCPSDQNFNYASKRDRDMKFRLHRPKPAVRVFKEVRIPKKATMLRERHHNEAERMRRVLEH